MSGAYAPILRGGGELSPTRACATKNERETFSLEEIRLPTLLGRWSDRVDGIGRGYTKGPVIALTKFAKDVAKNVP